MIAIVDESGVCLARGSEWFLPLVIGVSSSQRVLSSMTKDAAPVPRRRASSPSFVPMIKTKAKRVCKWVCMAARQDWRERGESTR